MANAYTNKLIKRMPAPGDFNWDDEWHDNEKIDDVVAGSLMSRNRIIMGGEVADGGGLNANHALIVCDLAGVRYEIAADSVVLAASSINYVYVDQAGAVAASPNPPAGDYIPLAVVDTDATSVVRIGDLRPMAQVLHIHSITSLKALSIQPPAGHFIYLAGRTTIGDGGEGLFYWDASDVSAKVAVDTQNGIYVPPDSDSTGASGAWVRFCDDGYYVDWFGAVADNTTDCAAAIQACIDFVAALNNGGTVRGRAGDYAIASGLVWKPKVSFDFDKHFRLRASAVMTAMLTAEVGAGNRIKRVALRGGWFDADLLAADILHLQEWEAVELSGMKLAECNGNYIHLGAAGQSSAPFELDAHNILITRQAAAFTTETPRGIFSDQDGYGTSDSNFADIVIHGCERGVDGEFYSCRFYAVHPWANKTADGTMTRGFSLQGDNNMLQGCDSDNASTYHYYFDGVRNIITECKTNRGTDYPDASGDVVYLVAGSSLVAKNNIFSAQSASYRINNEFSGDTSKLHAENNLTNNIVNVFGNQGAGLLEAQINFTTNAGSDPTVNSSYNVASINRLTDYDYTIYIDRDMSDTAYDVNISQTAVSYPQLIIPVLREKFTDRVRVQFYDPTGTLVRPNNVTVSVMGKSRI